MNRLTPDDWPGGRGAWVRFGLMLAVIWGFVVAAAFAFVARILLGMSGGEAIGAMLIGWLVGFVGFILVN